MQAGAGKRKGSSYERTICKRLSIWITAGERDDILWRSASSGAVFTVRKKSGRSGYASQVGDIAAIDPLADPFMKIFAVECKHYADLQLGNLVMGTSSILEEFILKHFNLAKSANKVPILIVKQNRGKDLLIGPAWLEKQFINIDSVCIKRLNCCIFNLENFMSKIDFDHFMNLIGNPLK